MDKCSRFIKMSYRLESKSWVKVQKEVKEKDTVLILGAGDINTIAGEVVERIKAVR